MKMLRWLCMMVLLTWIAPHALGQATIPVSGTHVTDNNGNLLTGQLVFTVTDATGTPVTYTPLGGSPTTATITIPTLRGVVQNVGGFVPQIPYPATMSPSNTRYQIQVQTTGGGTTYLDLVLTNITQPFFSYDAYSAPPGITINGIGLPKLPCTPTALYHNNSASDVHDWVCSIISQSQGGSIYWTQNPSENPACQNPGQAVVSPPVGAVFCTPSMNAYVTPGLIIGGPAAGTTIPGPVTVVPAPTGGTTTLPNNAIVFSPTPTTTRATIFSDIVGLFTGAGPCFLKNDGTCSNPSGGGSIPGTLHQAIYSAGGGNAFADTVATSDGAGNWVFGTYRANESNVLNFDQSYVLNAVTNQTTFSGQNFLTFTSQLNMYDAGYNAANPAIRLQDQGWIVGFDHAFGTDITIEGIAQVLQINPFKNATGDFGVIYICPGSQGCWTGGNVDPSGQGDDIVYVNSTQFVQFASGNTTSNVTGDRSPTVAVFNNKLSGGTNLIDASKPIVSGTLGGTIAAKWETNTLGLASLAFTGTSFSPITGICVITAIVPASPVLATPHTDAGLTCTTHDSKPITVSAPNTTVWIASSSGSAWEQGIITAVSGSGTITFSLTHISPHAIGDTIFQGPLQGGLRFDADWVMPIQGSTTGRWTNFPVVGAIDATHLLLGYPGRSFESMPVLGLYAEKLNSTATVFPMARIRSVAQDGHTMKLDVNSIPFTSGDAVLDPPMDAYLENAFTIVSTEITPATQGDESMAFSAFSVEPGAGAYSYIPFFFRNVYAFNNPLQFHINGGPLNPPTPIHFEFNISNFAEFAEPDPAVPGSNVLCNGATILCYDNSKHNPNALFITQSGDGAEFIEFDRPNNTYRFHTGLAAPQSSSSILGNVIASGAGGAPNYVSQGIANNSGTVGIFPMGAFCPSMINGDFCFFSLAKSPTSSSKLDILFAQGATPWYEIETNGTTAPLQIGGTYTAVTGPTRVNAGVEGTLSAAPPAGMAFTVNATNTFRVDTSGGTFSTGFNQPGITDGCPTWVTGLLTSTGLPCGTGGGSGVSSVGLVLPASVFSISGSPVTNSGSLTGVFINQSANTFFRGPTSGSAATPSFGVIVPADLPLATSSAFGAVKVDGTTIIATAGVISTPNSGTVTHTGGALTLNAFMLGAGGADSKVDTGSSSDGAGNVTFVSESTTGVAGTAGGRDDVQGTTQSASASGHCRLQALTGTHYQISCNAGAYNNVMTAGDFGTGILTFLGTPSSANLAAAVTDETGSGALVFGTAPTITLPNATGLPISTGVSGLGTGIATFLGTPSSANLAAAITDETGTGAAVFASGPTITLANATGLPTAGLVNNAVTSAKEAVVNTRRTCDIVIGDTSGSVITNAQLGPQKRVCYIPAASTIVEMDVAADGGTPNVIVGNNSAGTVTNIVSAALATAASGGIACSKTTAVTGIDGATTCSATLQNTTLNAGAYLELVSGTAGGTAKLMTIHIIYTVN